MTSRHALALPLTEPEGIALFSEASGRDLCLRLLSHFVTQDNLTFCGPASAAMVLNTIGIERPVSDAHSPYRLFDQKSLFVGPASEVLNHDRVRRSGMPLATFAAVLSAHGLNVSVHYAKDISLEEMTERLSRSVASPGSQRLVVVNYFRPLLGQDGRGHLSPVGAFHASTNRFLILDVARYKYPPVWVTANALHASMAMVDQESGLSRGFVEVTLKQA